MYTYVYIYIYIYTYVYIYTCVYAYIYIYIYMYICIHTCIHMVRLVFKAVQLPDLVPDGQADLSGYSLQGGAVGGGCSGWG